MPDPGAPPAGIRCLAAHAAAAPADDGWLASEERARLAGLRLARRRADWRLGRWTAKRLLAACVEPAALRDLVVRAAADGAPEPFLRGQALPLALSISHRASLAFCAVAPAGMRVGCDVELIEPRSDGFVADYLDDDERLLVGAVPPRARALLANLLWSCKESALKALRVGLRRDTRTVHVALRSGAIDGWRRADVRVEGARLPCWWRVAEGAVWTVAADPTIGVRWAAPRGW